MKLDHSLTYLPLHSAFNYKTKWWEIFLLNIFVSKPNYLKEYCHEYRKISSPNLRRFIHFLNFVSNSKRNYLIHLRHCKNILRESNHLNLKRKLFGLLWHCNKSLIELNKV